MRRAYALVGTIALVGTLVAFAPAASAQQPGYPPPLCNVTFSTQVLSSATVGSTITFSLAPVCDWTPGTSVSVSVNGIFVGNKVPAADGTIKVLVDVRSPALLAIDNPVLVPTRCGDTNVIRAVGFSAAARTTVTHEGTFKVACPAATPTPPRRQVAFTGDHVSVLSASALLFVIWGAHLLVAGRRRKARASA